MIGNSVMPGSENETTLVDCVGDKMELQEKRRRLQELLAEQKLDAILISRHENIAWATGGLVDLRVGVLRETGAGSLLVTKDGKVYYLTTNNEAARLAQEEFCQLGYEPLVQPWYANDVQISIRKIVGAGRVAGDMPFGDTGPVSLQPLRLELMPSEVARYRSLGRSAASAACAVVRSLQPGMSEMAIQGMLAERLISHGMIPSVYLTAVDDRVRSYRHPVPRDGVLQRFGMVGFCARRWGLSVSITRFVHFGTMPAELEERFAAAAQVNACLLEVTRSGVTSDELFAVAQEAYAALGYAGEEKMHHQGGVTGYAEREWVARPGGTECVAGTQAFAWNPNVQGAKSEETVVLHQGKIETLTLTSELPLVTTRLNGLDYHSSGVLVG